MRIAISGTSNTGKSTLVKNFMSVWNQYHTPEKTYRDIIKDKDHSHNTTKDTQWDILNFMVDQLQTFSKTDKVVFDRCPIDNLVYTLWAHEKGIDGFTKEFVDKCINITRESLRFLDIIFLLKYDESISIEDDGIRTVDINYIKEIDNIFSAIFHQYERNYDANVFFPKDDSPGVIVLPTTIEGRIKLISEYLTPSGELYGEEASILNPQNLDVMEQLLKQQKAALDKEQAEKELFKKFGLK